MTAGLFWGTENRDLEFSVSLDSGDLKAVRVAAGIALAPKDSGVCPSVSFQPVH